MSLQSEASEAKHRLYDLLKSTPAACIMFCRVPPSGTSTFGYKRHMFQAHHDVYFLFALLSDSASTVYYPARICGCYYTKPLFLCQLGKRFGIGHSEFDKEFFPKRFPVWKSGKQGKTFSNQFSSLPLSFPCVANVTKQPHINVS